MALLGFDPATYHTGRGPIEAAAQGLELEADDLVWRLNLVTVSKLTVDGHMRDYSSGHIATEVSTPIVEALQNKLGNEMYTFYPGVQYRHLLVQHGRRGPPTTPPCSSARRTTSRTSPSSQTCALFPKARFCGTFCSRPKRCSTTRGSIRPEPTPSGRGGKVAPLILPDFKEKFGLSGAVISAVDLIKGLGQRIEHGRHRRGRCHRPAGHPTTRARWMRRSTSWKTTTSSSSTWKARTNAATAATRRKRSRPSADSTPAWSRPCARRSRIRTWLDRHLRPFHAHRGTHPYHGRRAVHPQRPRLRAVRH